MKRLTVFVLLGLFVFGVAFAPAITRAQDDGAEATIFTTEDGAYLAVVPPGWVATGSRDDGVRIVNSEGALERDDDGDVDRAAGDIVVSVTVLPPEIFAAITLPEDFTPLDVLGAFIPLIVESNEETLEIGEAEETTLGEMPAATVTGQDDDTAAKIWVWEIAPGHFALGSVATPPGELDAALEIGEIIVSTAQFSLPLEETYESLGGEFTMPYPTGWTYLDTDGVYFFSNESVQAKIEEGTADPVYEEGEYVAIFLPLTLLDAEPEDLESELVNTVNSLLEEGDEATEPTTITIGETELIGITVTGDRNDGGAFITTTPQGVFMVLYSGPKGDGGLVVYTLVNMVLNVE